MRKSPPFQRGPAAAPKGDVADAPKALVFDDSLKWKAGKPDLVVVMNDVTKLAGTPDWWGEIDYIPTGLEEDRYVKSVEVVEVNDVDNTADAGTVGGRYIFHHMIWGTAMLDENGERAPGLSIPWPVHEVGRNADIFDEDAGRLSSRRVPLSYRIQCTSIRTAEIRLATSKLASGSTIKITSLSTRTRSSGSVMASTSASKAMPKIRSSTPIRFSRITRKSCFEPHLHAPGERMCLEAIWGYTIETLSCVGYDHNWVRGYPMLDQAAPILPKGTILHIVGYMNNTETNPNVPDPRNWQGSGNRSVTNMFIDLGIRVRSQTSSSM